MPKVIHTNSAVRRVAADQVLDLVIQIGHAQTGQWWVKLDEHVVHEGTGTDNRIPLGPAANYYGKVLQVEVRCDDTNPQVDDLAALIALVPANPELAWETDNEGQQVPHGSMTSFMDIFIRKAI